MKSKLMLALTAIISMYANAQNTVGIYGENNWLNGWTNFKPKIAEYSETSQILNGEIKENLTLTKKSVYLLVGNVYVTNGATLTIEPGTIIRGDYNTTGTLIIVKGSKIVAEGTESNPIIFTSNKVSSERKSGDWGGIIIMVMLLLID